MASPGLSASTQPTSLASDVEPPPATIHFTNIKELFQAIDQVSGDFLVVQSKYYPAIPLPYPILIIRCFPYRF
jgi:hypothetical protein